MASPNRPGRNAREILGSVAVLGGVLAAVLAAALALSRVRDDDGPRAVAPGLLAGDPGPIHVHGLGINPSDEALFIATHTGMWRVGKGETEAERVTDRSQDTMGFTVAGPDRFLGSGHPDVREAREKDLPPLLGLIESRDAGRTWTPVSLLGEADFHVLRFTGDRVYGFDATNNRLMVSRDGSKTWTARRPPGPLVDLVADPTNSAHIIASTERGLLDSADAGRSWQPLGGSGGLLAWPTRNRLYRLDGEGQVFVARYGVRRWTSVGQIGGQPAAFLARSTRELYVALHDGTIKRSVDGGETWDLRSTP